MKLEETDQKLTQDWDWRKRNLLNISEEEEGGWINYSHSSANNRKIAESFIQTAYVCERKK